MIQSDSSNTKVTGPTYDNNNKTATFTVTADVNASWAEIPIQALDSKGNVIATKTFIYKVLTSPHDYNLIVSP
jgi:hypothetical protein